MKSKIALFTMFIIILNSVFVYANDDTVIISNDVFASLQEEFEYDSRTDTYYFPSFGSTLGKGTSSRSGAVAVSGAVISSVLTLAVKAGIDFASTNSMSEFVSRFFMLDGISSVVGGINDVVKKSVDGTLNFSRSLLDTVGSKFSELMSKGSVYSTYVQGRRLMTVKYGSGSISSTMARYIFENSTVPKVSFSGEDIISSGTNYNFDSDIFLPIGDFGTFSITAQIKDSSPYYDRVYGKYKTADGTYKPLSSSYSYVDFPSDSFIKGFRYYAVPFLAQSSSKYYVGFIVACYSTVTGFFSRAEATITSATFSKSHVGSSSPMPVIGDSWSDGVISGDDSSSSGDLSISIPKDTNQLANKKPVDISTPSYETWTPGTVIIPPAIDTGTSSPPVDDVLPPITDDVPDSGTDTDNPGGSIPSLNLDWLKELIQSIIDLIKSIIDWLSNFWIHLWEFLKSLLVPGETYFVDEFGKVTEKMKEKIPSIDITKLEDLAVGEFKFKDIYANFFGIECLVVRGSLINNVIGWARPIIQGLIALFLLLYNYNQIYVLIRGTSLLGATNTIDNMDRNRVGGRR